MQNHSRGLTVPFLVIALCLGGKVLKAEPYTEKITQLLAKEWSKVAQPSAPEPSFWRFQLTPPLPAIWPAQGSGKICYYAYAQAVDPRLSDGVRVAAPWAKALLDSPFRSEGLRMEILSRQLQVLGIQGVRPLSSQEMEIMKEEYRARDALLLWTTAPSPVSEQDRKRMKDYYCQWVNSNGLIAANIRPLHEEFFTWLGCGV